MKSAEIRQRFLDFFEKKSHTIVPSAPMVIKGDPTLMFTNAGMNQFKDIILGNVRPKATRVADSQKCLRVSGKHNDLEEVGHDTYHHTMFEMLGNWSFGDYFKKEAIAYAWEFLTEEMGLDKNRLYATVFEGSKENHLEEDKEALEYWKLYLPEDRILYGNKKDNFWEMGDMGPCGPCSEIHIDLRPEAERALKPGRELVNKDNPLVIEIWNLVFMQYNRKADGSLENLPSHHVDTGMGFERLCMAVQGKTSNYDTDVFTPIIGEIARLSGKEYGKDAAADVAMRVIADHLRTIAFSITDGQLPSNVKAGYVIRRILRRAVRYAYTFLDQKDAFMYKLVPVLIEVMGQHYPELSSQRVLIERVIQEEENAFLRTLDKGIKLLDKIIEKTKAEDFLTVPGNVAFELYDTYGFPLDLTELILKENGLVVNRREFKAEMEAQKERSRSAAAVSTDDWVELIADDTQEFVGYDYTETEVQITRYRRVNTKGKTLYQLVFNITPFYGESGGQVGDRGWLISETEKINVLDVNIDSCTAKEAMKETIAFLESEPVSVIDVVSVDGLMQMNDLSELKARMNEFDLVLPGEKLILEAAEEARLPKEIDIKLYLKMFMRYLHKNHKRMYLLVESEEDGQEAFRYMQRTYSGIQLVGLAKVSAEGRADDMLVNAINGSEVDCILSALSVPLQEDFIAKNRNLLDARVWVGVGNRMFSDHRQGLGHGKLAKFLLNHIFKREMEKNKLKMKS